MKTESESKIRHFNLWQFMDLPTPQKREGGSNLLAASVAMIIALVAYVTMPKERRKREYANP